MNTISNSESSSSDEFVSWYDDNSGYDKGRQIEAISVKIREQSKDKCKMLACVARVPVRNNFPKTGRAKVGARK